MRSLFIFGIGYSGQEIARAAKQQGYAVAGTCRDAGKCEMLKGHGIDAYRFDQVPSSVLAAATHVLNSIPPQEGVGDLVLAQYGKLLPEDAWLGYLSTTGVYGDWSGAWVDEQSELRAGNARLERRVAAEGQWQKLGGHVFRLAGIYGPGRNAVEDVRAGEARRLDKPGQVFSRIHVVDIAQTVLASMVQPHPGAAYNVCDDEPAPASDVVAYACELAGVPILPLIPFAQAQMSPMAREFYSANRRVNNLKIKEELGVVLRYPTYREGLRAVNL